MRSDEEGVRLSPSDLAKYLVCPALATLVAEKGHLHKREYLAQLRSDGREVSKIGLDGRDFEEAAAATEPSMHDGAEVVYQATSAREGWRGLAESSRRPLRRRGVLT